MQKIYNVLQGCVVSLAKGGAFWKVKMLTPIWVLPSKNITLIPNRYIFIGYQSNVFKRQKEN
jgi:hypothetical protein